MRPESAIDKLANKWVERLAELSPTLATDIGYPGGEDKLNDYSPEHAELIRAERNALLAQVEKIAPVDLQDEVTLHAMRNRFGLEEELHQANVARRDLNNLASPAQGIRDVFDNSKTETEQDWKNLVGRLNAVTGSLESYQRSLELGIAANDAPARRQVEIVLEQVARITKSDGFFFEFAKNAKPESGELPESLKAELAQAAKAATSGYAKFGEFLKSELLPNASEVDAIGRERYELFSRDFLGAKVDIDETYEWGIEELARMKAEQEATAKRIKPGATIAEAIEHLNSDPKRKLNGKDELQKWMQAKSDQAVSELGKSHFDIAPEIQTLECMIAPSNSGGIYYTGPSDDFSRPGRMWWSVPEGVTEFDTWRELTTVYHEGVPGHHLQVGQATYNRAELNAWRRLILWTSGHGEGWALYAERLMAQLGYLDDPGDYMGMLDGQRLRAARVVLDIAVHCNKPRLDGTGKWDFEYAHKFLRENSMEHDSFVEFEVNRYFGWPGQAPSYKIGQRIWEQLAAESKASGEDQKAFHKKVLNLGGIPLDTLKFALSR